jgi:hypothetical protein
VYHDSIHFIGDCLPFIISRMSQKNKIALLFVGAGLLSGIVLSYHLPAEKLAIALTGPSAVVGAGLTQWNSKNDQNNDQEEN